MEWDCNQDLSLGGLNLPLMPKQQAPWLSYKFSQEKGKWAGKAVSIWTSKMESGCLGWQLPVIPSETCLPRLHPQHEEPLPGNHPSNICLWEEHLFGVEYHSHTRSSCTYVQRWQNLMSLQRIFKLLNRIAYLLVCLSLSICNKNQADAIMWSPGGIYLEALLFFSQNWFEVVYNSSFQTVIENLNGGELSRGAWRGLKQQRICWQYVAGTTNRGAEESTLALKPMDSNFNSESVT